jgi:hypothetical protein
MTVTPKDILSNIISWSTLAGNVKQLSDWEYLVSTHPENVNDPGAGIMAVDDYFVANWGGLYSITNISGENITVNDDFQTGRAPNTGLAGIVFRSICNGSSQWLPPIRYEVLDRSAKSYLETITNEILYRNKGDVGTLVYPTDFTTHSVSRDFKNFYSEIPEGRMSLKVFRQGVDIGDGRLKDYEVEFTDLVVTVSGFTLIIDPSTESDLTGVQIYFSFNRKL